MHKNMMMTMVGFGALLLSSTAMAQEPDASAAPPAASPATEADKPSKTVKASSETVWYGHQTLAVDGAAIGMMALGLSSSSRTGLAFIGLGTYALGAPTVHALHGNWGRGLADVGIRVGAPVALGAAGVVGGMMVGGMGSSSGDDSGLRMVVFGALGGVAGVTGGMIVASVVDAAALAHEKVPQPEQRSSGVRWTPVASVTPEGATGGVAGQF
jgi:hypothetical protein